MQAIVIFRALNIKADVKNGRLILFDANDQKISEEEYMRRIKAYFESWEGMPRGKEEDPTDWYLD